MIAEAIIGLLRQYKSAPADVRGTLAAMLRWMARDLERYVVPGVSRAAQARADELELGDLSKFHWGHQRAAMKDPTREIFHWEHVVPVSDIVQALVALENPMPSTIAPILMRAEIAWILKSEDKVLRRRGRPDPRAAYVAAGIELLAWSQSSSDTEDPSQPTVL
ncbi:hypothetical protein [Bosea lathyri]|uniref:hypothetical protein n=1 Tax=Bosea lathyri TaxID=1036778 RepID=UPI0011B03A7D|nr:hypothetical protein [Bosea lathyri]